MNELTTEAIEYIISRLIDNAMESAKDFRSDMSNSFKAGRNEAYYEMLDIIKSELEVRDQDLSKFGLDFDLEKTIA